jgi:apolipoprotein D and lipocalin family protein
MRHLKVFILPTLLLAGCAGTPVNAVPVSGFEADKYLGTWYEVARLNNSFERGLSAVTATYSKRDDDGIKVLNRGCNVAKGKWKDATGKAYFTEDETIGKLKVSFFGPFYGDYIVFDLGTPDYDHAYVSGGSSKYLWLLARTPQVSETRKADFIQKSKALGYETDTLIWVDHAAPCA